MITNVKILYMQVNNAGISGTILDSDAFAALGDGKVSFPSMICFYFFLFLLFFAQKKDEWN